jgi:hypothetical protein
LQLGKHDRQDQKKSRIILKTESPNIWSLVSIPVPHDLHDT